LRNSKLAIVGHRFGKVLVPAITTSSQFYFMKLALNAVEIDLKINGQNQLCTKELPS